MEPGTRIGTFEITGMLGKGGMGEVYRARDTKLGREVAIKVLPKHFADDTERMARFEREAKVLASVDHANIGALYDFREEKGTHFLVLQLIEGETLEERIARGPIPEAEAIDLFVQIARALEAAHKKGVIHRDLKPANIKITPEGQIKVLDFGMAKPQEMTKPLSPTDPTRLSNPNKVTATGAVMGTPSYMSPEQARGHEVDERTDVWAFGCCLYESLTGQLPFKGDTIADAISAVLQLEPDYSVLPKGSSSSVVNVLKNALVKESHDRISSMSDLIDGLLVEGETPTTHDGFRVSMPMIAVVSGLMILVGGGLWFNRGPATQDSPSLEEIVAENKVESIVVLPFDNTDLEGENDHIVDGMTLAIIRELRKIKSLRVVSKTTAMSYKNTNLSLSEIAAVLKVDAILEGEVSLEGDTVEIYADLRDPEREESLWDETLSDKFESVIQLHRKIALGVAVSIEAPLSPEERAKLEEVKVVNREAMEAYLFGMDLLNRRQLPQSIPHFRKAIKSAPEFSLPYSALANTYSLFGTFGKQPPSEAFETARTLVEKALEIDPLLADAHAILGWILANYDHNWAAADESFLRAQELDPEHPPAYFWHALTLAYRNRMDDAIEKIDYAVQMDPVSIPANRLRIEIYAMAGLYEDVLDLGQRHLELAPDDSVAGATVADAYARNSELEKAREILEPYLGRDEVPYTGSMTHVQKRLGMDEKLQSTLDSMLERSKTEFIPSYSIGIVYAALERYEDAIAMFQESYEKNEPMIVLYNRHDLLEPIFDDARIQKIYQDLDLPLP